MKNLIGMWDSFVNKIQPAGDWVAILPIRLLMGHEFFSAGLRKFNASDTLWGDVPGWFAGKAYPFPFNLFPPELNWFLVTWTEILGGAALFVGLFTRFWAFSLIIVTFVAIASSHWPAEWSNLAELWKGYTITDKGHGNFRIPLLFLAMLFALFFAGAGKFSLDHPLFSQLRNRIR